MTAQTKATEQGISDATDFINENDATVIQQALAPGQEAPDEALINALGIKGTAALFGVQPETAAWSKALDQYNKAWLKTVAAHVAE